MNKKITALTLFFCMLFAASCGGTSGDTDGTTAPVTTEPPVTDDGRIRDSIPEGTDFGGKQINVFIADYNTAYSEDRYAVEEDGNRLHDAIFRTITSTEERLNVDLSYTVESFNWDGMNAFNTKLMASIMADDGSIDVLYSPLNYAERMLEGNYFIDLSKTKYIDTDKPWYNQSVIENMPGDYIHFLAGQIGIANVKNAFGIYVNTDKYAALGKTENLYEIVDSGKWTFDKMEAIIKDSYRDVNGNTEADETDEYGLTFGDQNKYLGFLKAFGMDIFVKTADGYEFAFDNERGFTAMERLVRFVNENENVYRAPTTNTTSNSFSTGGGNYASPQFIEGNSLFSCSLIADAATIIPEIKFGYGLLPYPKFDEAQEDYATMLQRNLFVLIPTTSRSQDEASAVIEALSSETYNTLLPEFCEVSLKVRYAQDNDMSRMFDLIGSSIVYDPGEIYASLLGTPSGQIKAAVNNNDTNWVSRMNGMKAGLIEKMNAITVK